MDAAIYTLPTKKEKSHLLSKAGSYSLPTASSPLSAECNEEEAAISLPRQRRKNRISSLAKAPSLSIQASSTSQSHQSSFHCSSLASSEFSPWDPSSWLDVSSPTTKLQSSIVFFNILNRLLTLGTFRISSSFLISCYRTPVSSLYGGASV